MINIFLINHCQRRSNFMKRILNLNNISNKWMWRNITLQLSLEAQSLVKHRTFLIMLSEQHKYRLKIKYSLHFNYQEIQRDLSFQKVKPSLVNLHRLINLRIIKFNWHKTKKFDFYQKIKGQLRRWQKFNMKKQRIKIVLSWIKLDLIGQEIYLTSWLS